MLLKRIHRALVHSLGRIDHFDNTVGILCHNRVIALLPADQKRKLCILQFFDGQLHDLSRKAVVLRRILHLFGTGSVA